MAIPPQFMKKKNEKEDPRMEAKKKKAAERLAKLKSKGGK